MKCKNCKHGIVREKKSYKRWKNTFLHESEDKLYRGLMSCELCYCTNPEPEIRK